MYKIFICSILLTLLLILRLEAASVPRFEPLADTLAKYKIARIPDASDYPDLPAVAVLSFQEYRQLGSKHERRFHKIVKVLNSTGKEYTTFRIPCYSSCHVEARTIKADGKMINLPGKDLFRSQQVSEYSSPYFVARFAMPGVEPGDLIEYRATVEYPVPFLIDEFRFAEPYPILKGVFVLVHPEGDSYRYVRESPSATPIEVVTDSIVESNNRWIRTTFVVNRVRASMEEPYSPDTRLGQPGIQILIEKKSGRQFDAFRDWWSYGEFIAEQAKVNALLDPGIRNFIAQASGTGSDPIGIVKNIYRAAEERIRITSESLLMSGFTFQNPLDVYEEKVGTPQDFALFLADCFKSLRFGADLILVNSHQQAEASDQAVFPSLLDMIFLNVKTPQGEILLDCNQNGLPPGVISSRAMNRFALGVPVLFDVRAGTQKVAYTTRMPFQSGNTSHLTADLVAEAQKWTLDVQWILSGEFRAEFLKISRKNGNSEFQKAVELFLKSRIAAAEWRDMRFQILPSGISMKAKATIARKNVTDNMERLQNDFWNSGFELRRYLLENRLNELLLPVTGEISSTFRIHVPPAMVASLPPSADGAGGPVHYTLMFRKEKGEIVVDEKITIKDLAVKPAEFPKFGSFLDDYYIKHFWSILLSSRMEAAK